MLRSNESSRALPTRNRRTAVCDSPPAAVTVTSCGTTRGNVLMRSLHDAELACANSGLLRSFPCSSNAPAPPLVITAVPFHRNFAASFPAPPPNHDPHTPPYPTLLRN